MDERLLHSSDDQSSANNVGSASEQARAARQAAAVAGHTGDSESARALTTYPDPKVRATALGALARLAQLTAQEVRVALADSDASVRKRACGLAIPFLELDLVAMLDDSSSEVVEHAAWALGERSDRAGEAAVNALSAVVRNHEDALCREAAVAALGAIGDNDGLAAILKGTTDKPAVRRRAVLALAPFDGPEVDAALERAKSDRDWQVRQAAEDLSD